MKDGTPLDTPGFVRALSLAMRRRLDDEAEAVLGNFAEYSFPRDAIDAGPVTALVATHWDAVCALTRRRDANLRHAAVWALGLSGDARAVRPIVAVLTHQHDFFDHDFGYMACGRLGAEAIPELRSIALDGSADERLQAVQCIGQSRGDPDAALRALTDVAHQGAVPEHFFNALYNLHDPRTVSLALLGLESSDPQIRLDALGAISSAVRIAVEDRRRLPETADRIAAAIAPLLDGDERIWTDDGDPWGSMFAWSIESLALLRHPLGRTTACRALLRGSRRTEGALEALRMYRIDAGVVAALSPLIERRPPSIHAALVLRRSRRASVRARAGEVLLRRILRGARDDEWDTATTGSADDRALIERMLDAAGADRTRARRMRARVIATLAHVAQSRRDGDGWLKRSLAGRPRALAVAVRQKWASLVATREQFLRRLRLRHRR